MANVFSHAGKAWVAKKCEGTETASPNRIGWGTGAGTALVTDTTLFTESGDPAARATATLSTVTTTQTDDTFQAVGTLTSGGSQTITNTGLFDAATGGDMILKGDHAGVPLQANDQITYTFKLQYT